MTPEQQARREAEVNAAWATLASSDAFRTIMEDAQGRYGMFKPSFLPDDAYNTNAAARRDGQKEVLADFMRRVARHGAVIPNSQDQTP